MEKGGAWMGFSKYLPSTYIGRRWPRRKKKRRTTAKKSKKLAQAERSPSLDSVIWRDAARNELFHKERVRERDDEE